jgi:hypothetical protein
MIKDMAREFAQKGNRACGTYCHETGGISYETVKKMSAQSSPQASKCRKNTGRRASTRSATCCGCNPGIAKADVSALLRVSYTTAVAHGIFKVRHRRTETKWLVPDSDRPKGTPTA